MADTAPRTTPYMYLLHALENMDDQLEHLARAYPEAWNAGLLSAQWNVKEALTRMARGEDYNPQGYEWKDDRVDNIASEQPAA